MTEFTKFAVGEAWPGAMLPQEALYFDYTAEGGAAFVLFFNTPTEKEAKGVRRENRTCHHGKTSDYVHVLQDSRRWRVDGCALFYPKASGRNEQSAGS